MMTPTRTIIDLLFYEAKRSPYLAELIANVDEMTVEEIQAAKTKLPWMRQALLKLKKKHQDESTILSISVDLENHIILSYSPDPIGEARRWLGNDTFIIIDRGSSILVPHRKLLWFPQSGGFWMQYLFSKHIDNKLYQYTETVSTMTKKEYTLRYEEELNGNYKHHEFPQTENTASPTLAGGVLSQYGVRFR